MGKIYTVVLNSSIANDTTTQSERFFYDWSQIEEGKYECQFTFVGAVGGTPPTFGAVPNIFLDLGQGAYTNIASSNVPTSGNIGGSFSALYLGSLETRSYTTIAGSSTYYCAGTTTNPPFYLDNRPRNNFIVVSLFTNTNAQGNPYAPIPGPYTMTLQLKKIY